MPNKLIPVTLEPTKMANGNNTEGEDDGFIAAINNIVNDNEVWNDDNIET